MHGTFRHRGNSYSIHSAQGAVHLEGEFAGNIDLSVSVKPPIAIADVVDCLRLEVPGTPEPLAVLGSLENAGTLELTFFSELIDQSGMAPPTVELYWESDDKQPLGSVACARA